MKKPNSDQYALKVAQLQHAQFSVRFSQAEFTAGAREIGKHLRKVLCTGNRDWITTHLHRMPPAKIGVKVATNIADVARIDEIKRLLIDNGWTIDLCTVSDTTSPFTTTIIAT